jgi:hypothetical protein
MSSYILFIYGSFEDHEDLELLFLEHFNQVSEAGLKYVIEAVVNCIIIFDSDKEKTALIDDLKVTLDIDEVKFYLIFEKKDLFFAELPEAIRNLIFKPKENAEDFFKINIREIPIKHDLDTILEKIQVGGVESLTEEEKKYLDGFGK